jgi:hypothetical protein
MHLSATPDIRASLAQPAPEDALRVTTTPLNAAASELPTRILP